MTKVFRPAGFTLIEILIAMAILAVIGLIMAAALEMAIRDKNIISAHADRLSETQYAIMLMERELLQFINRPVVNNDGKQLKAFMVRILHGKPYMEFTHGGYINPFGIENRSTLQRVGYAWDGKNLLRITWAVLDRAPGSRSDSQVLLSDVSGFTIRALDVKQHWHTVEEILNARQMSLPLAVEINLEVNRVGHIRRVIPFPEGNGNVL